MHELGITRSIVETGSQRAAGRPVARVTVEVGRLVAVMPDAMRFCYDICAVGTELEGSVLEIVEMPAAALCRDCGAHVVLDQTIGRCDCGGIDLELVAGQELRVREMELA